MTSNLHNQKWKKKLEGTVCFSILKSLQTISYQNIYDNHVCHLKVVFILLLRNIFFCKYLFDLQTNFAGNKFSESLKCSIFIIAFFVAMFILISILKIPICFRVAIETWLMYRIQLFLSQTIVLTQMLLNSFYSRVFNDPRIDFMNE